MKQILWIVFVSFSVSCFAIKTLSLEDLQVHIKQKRSTWTAGPTKMSILSREEQLEMFGAQIPIHSDFFFLPLKTTAAPLPATLNWRNREGVNYTAPVLDQGRCGACVAFAAIGQMETQLNITGNTPSSPWAFSPQHLFSCGGGSCKKGWKARAALSLLQSSGVPDEACFPYQSGAVGEDIACSETCPDSKKRAARIAHYKSVSSFFSSVDTLKKALLKGPLLAHLDVYEDFMFYKGGVYRHVSGGQLAGHAVSIIGWNDTDSAWIVRNSWGEDWGEKGDFRIGWTDSGIETSTFSMEVSPSDGLVSLGGLRDYMVLNGKAILQLESTFPDTRRVRWQLQKKGKVVQEGDTTTFETAALPDGVYQLLAIAETAAGQKVSQPREIYLLNNPISGSLSFGNVGSCDTLKGKKILGFSVQSKPIPFNLLVFRAVNAKTGQVIERRSSNVASRINLSFNTRRLENGDWDLSLEGIAGIQSVSSPTVRVAIKN